MTFYWRCLCLITQALWHVAAFLEVANLNIEFLTPLHLPVFHSFWSFMTFGQLFKVLTPGRGRAASQIPDMSTKHPNVQRKSSVQTASLWCNVFVSLSYQRRIPVSYVKIYQSAEGNDWVNEVITHPVLCHFQCKTLEVTHLGWFPVLQILLFCNTTFENVLN